MYYGCETFPRSREAGHTPLFRHDLPGLNFPNHPDGPNEENDPM